MGVLTNCGTKLAARSLPSLCRTSLGVELSLFAEELPLPVLENNPEVPSAAPREAETALAYDWVVF